jgi:hypothetical protein
MRIVCWTLLGSRTAELRIADSELWTASWLFSCYSKA